MSTEVTTQEHVGARAGPRRLPSRLLTIGRTRGGGWCVRWFQFRAEGGIIRRSKSFQTRRAANKFRNSQGKGLDDKPHTRTAPREITLGEFADEIGRTRRGSDETRLRLTSVQLCQRALRRLAKHVGRDKLLTEITSVDADSFIETLYDDSGRTGGKLSKWTVSKTVRTLKACFNVALKHRNYITVNPFAGHKTSKPPKPVTRYITNTEFSALLKAADADPAGRSLWWKAFLTLCYTTGLRYAEAVNLTWGDLDFETGTVHVTAKRESKQTLAWEPKTTESIRDIPAPATAMDLLARLQETAATGFAYVFIPPERFEAVKAAKEKGVWRETMPVLNNFQRGMRSLVKRAAKTEPSLLDGDGKPSVSIHDFRRTCITHWADVVSMKAASELAGHSSIETTSAHYATTTERHRELARQAAQAASTTACGVELTSELTSGAKIGPDAQNGESAKLSEQRV